MRRLVRREQVADAGARQHRGDATADRLDKARGVQGERALRQSAGGPAHDVEKEPDQDGPAPPETVGQGADHHLADAQAQEEGRQRLVDLGDGGAELPRDGGQRRKVQVDADGGEDRQDAEQGDQFDPSQAGDFRADWGLGHGTGMGLPKAPCKAL
jgi:hypothetical protein